MTQLHPNSPPLQHVVEWDINNPTEFQEEAHYSAISGYKNFGARIVVPQDGVAWKIFGGRRSFWAFQSCPGMIPLYLAHTADGKVGVSHSLRAARGWCRVQGVPFNRILICREGIAYQQSSRGLKKYVVDRLEPHQFQVTDDLDKAADLLFERLVEAAKPLKGRKVCTTISGGTDGLLSAIALREAGVDQVCVCIGTSEDEFDPLFAANYAKYLGLDYQFIKLRTEQEYIEELRDRALRQCEMSDFSNVLMAMCNLAIGDWMADHAINCTVNADIADVALGNDNFTCAGFKKTGKTLASKWAEYRIDHQLKNLPTNFMIYKSYAFSGIEPWQLFADREVLRLLLSCGLHVTPVEHKKPLYYTLANRFVSGGSWNDNGKKVGFYSGSGIGKIRLENPALADAVLRRRLAEIDEEN